MLIPALHASTRVGLLEHPLFAQALELLERIGAVVLLADDPEATAPG